MKKKKFNSESKWGAFNVSRTNMWGTYCPETGEYYLAHRTYVPEVGEYTEVLASAYYVREDEWQEQSYSGYSLEVVRELLRLGHLTPKTLEKFQQADGEVWWEQHECMRASHLLKEENIMKVKRIRIELENLYQKARSAWSRGVILYADELLNNIQDEGEITEARLLNGARNWKEYSEGCSLIYDADICQRLCAPWEIKKKHGGILPPNGRETWLDVQARALYQAAQEILSIANEKG